MTLDVITQFEHWTSILRRFNHDFYHTPEYHWIAQWAGEGEPHLFHYVEGDYAIALPLLIRRLDDIPGIHPGAAWRDATSVYGYAGPIASHAGIPEPVLSNFQSHLRARLADMNVVSLFTRLHPLLDQRAMVDSLGEYRKMVQTVSVDLTLPLEIQRANYRDSLKTAINKLRRRGVTFFLDETATRLDTFIDLYYETMHRVDAIPMYFFPREYFYRLRDAFGDRFHLGFCQYAGQITCGAIFIEYGETLHYHLGGTFDHALEFAPMKLLLDSARTWATGRGLRTFHLGGGATSQPDDPLLHFKLGFSDRAHQFVVWCWPVDEAACQKLSSERARWFEETGQLALSPRYFPQYRTPALAGPVLTTGGESSAHQTSKFNQETHA